jgi:hypothetical protein
MVWASPALPDQPATEDKCRDCDGTQQESQFPVVLLKHLREEANRSDAASEDEQHSLSNLSHIVALRAST